MSQTKLFETIPHHRLSSFSQEEIYNLVDTQSRVIRDLVRENALLKKSRGEKQQSFKIDEEYIRIKTKLLGTLRDKTEKKAPKPAKSRILLPSVKYPEAEVVEQIVKLETKPDCTCCGKKMSFSGMFESTEFLTVTPAIYKVVRQRREKYRCSACHGDVKTAPTPPRICPGSSYGDDLIIDVSLSKYCDLIPIERYAAIAGREGLKEIPAHSLIQLSHYLANYVKPIYDKIKEEILDRKVLHADETPHRMLEDHGGKKSWYLWGFSDNQASSYFEIRNTRSGDVASELLKTSKCEYLVSDVYSGYNKAVRETNKVKKERGENLVQNAYCNAHAYRKFRDLDDEFIEFKKLYKKIYRLEKIAQKYPAKALRLRGYMKSLFEKIKSLCLAQIASYSSKSEPSKAMSYFVKNYQSLTLFIEHNGVPIDNNPQERQMRNPVIGRKTWYGNHSLKGAQTSAILFSIVESCKLAGINPREYFQAQVKAKQRGESLKTPLEYRKV